MTMTTLAFGESPMGTCSSFLNKYRNWKMKCLALAVNILNGERKYSLRALKIFKSHILSETYLILIDKTSFQWSWGSWPKKINETWRDCLKTFDWNEFSFERQNKSVSVKQWVFPTKFIENSATQFFINSIVTILFS